METIWASECSKVNIFSQAKPPPNPEVSTEQNGNIFRYHPIYQTETQISDWGLARGPILVEGCTINQVITKNPCYDLFIIKILEDSIDTLVAAKVAQQHFKVGET